MKIFNIFSISEPFKTGASGSGLGVPYTIQYNMSVMGTELDGTRYIRNYGKGGNSFNAEAFASNHIYLNGTTQSVPYPILHTLGSDTLNAIAPTESNGDEVTTFSSLTDNSFNLAVTTVGTSASRPRITTNNIDTADGKTVLFSFDIVVNSGNCSIFNVIAYGHANEEIGITLTTGHYDFEIPITGTLTNSQFYFDGTALFDISVTNWTVKEITLQTASYFTYFDSTTNTLTELSSTGDRGATLPVSTTYSATDSHQFVFNHTIPLEDIDVSALEADPNLAFRMLHGEVLPSGFSNADVGWFSGGNEGLLSGKYEQDLSVPLGSADATTDITSVYGGQVVTPITNGWNIANDGTGVNIRVGSTITEDLIIVWEFDAILNSGEWIIDNILESAGDYIINKSIITGKYSIIFKYNSTYTFFIVDAVSPRIFDVDITNSITRLASAVEIQDYDTLCRTTLSNQSNGASNLKLIQDGSGRTTGIAVANTTQWEADGRTAVTSWTITAPFTVAEIINGDTYLFTSDGNRFKNLIADGTYTVPTGIWTLDEFGFDGVTPVTVRGVTGMIEEVVIP